MTWIKLLAFSADTQAELMRRGDGDSLSASGTLKADFYAPEGREARVSLTLFVDNVLALRAPATEKKAKAPDDPLPRQPAPAAATGAWDDGRADPMRARCGAPRRAVMGVPMTEREKMPTRRRCSIRNFRHAGRAFSICAGYHEDGRMGEIFLASDKPGSEIESIAVDAGIVTRLALQFGCPIELIRHALTKNADGSPATVLGAALSALAIVDMEPP